MDITRSRTVAAHKVACAGWVSSALEFYDFFLFNTAAVLFFGPIFFPNTSPEVQTTAVLVSVGAGFIGRPLGAVMFGHLGDVYGRRLVLCLTTTLMAISSFGIGILPTYKEIGLAAPCSLLVLRILQGFFISGQHASSSALALEMAVENRRGMYASFTLSGTQIGYILSCSVFICLPLVLSEEALSQWGWRLPFLISLPLAVVGVWIRLSVPESDLFLAERKPHEKTHQPLKLLWSGYRSTVLRVVLAAQISVVSTIFSVFSLSWAITNTSLSRNHMLTVMIANAALGMVVIPVWAYISDRIGRRRVFLFGSMGCGILIWPYFWSLSQSSIPLSFLFGVLLSGLVYSAANGVWPSLYAEMFCTKVRVSGVAIGTQLGFMLAAQSAPLAAFLIRDAVSNWPVVAVLVSVCCCISSLAVFLAPETHKQALTRLG